MLGNAGYAVAEAATGELAIAFARSQRPDLIITHILMPDMDGYELVNKLRRPGGPEASESPTRPRIGAREIATSASEFVEMIVGVGASQVDEELAVGDAVRWVGPGVWRVEEVAGDRVTLRLWPDNEPYPERINEVGPGEWPDRAA